MEVPVRPKIERLLFDHAVRSSQKTNCRFLRPATSIISCTYKFEMNQRCVANRFQKNVAVMLQELAVKWQDDFEEPANSLVDLPAQGDREQVGL